MRKPSKMRRWPKNCFGVNWLSGNSATRVNTRTAAPSQPASSLSRWRLVTDIDRHKYYETVCWLSFWPFLHYLLDSVVTMIIDKLSFCNVANFRFKRIIFIAILIALTWRSIKLCNYTKAGFPMEPSFKFCIMEPEILWQWSCKILKKFMVKIFVSQVWFRRYVLLLEHFSQKIPSSPIVTESMALW